jgi:hypothetical protein
VYIFTNDLDYALPFKTAGSIQDVDSEMRKMVVQIDLTSASLESLVRPGQPDLENAFNAYSDNVSKLENEGSRAIKRLDEMKLNSKEYFAEWEKYGYRIYDGRPDPYSAGDCYNSRSGTCYSGAKDSVKR